MATYCSWCLKSIEPKRIKSSRLTRNLYQCPNCKRHIVECRACKNFACWDGHKIENNDRSIIKVSQHDQYCAEHRHAVANFDTLNAKIKYPSDYRIVFERRKPNLAKATAVALFIAGGLAVSGPIAFYAGPAIGGIIGTKILGLTGSAATKAGMALLCGGAKAVGGFGMAGGLVVTSTVGAAVGGALGAYVSNAYFGQIQDFDIRKVRTGKGPAVITVNGFLSQEDEGWSDWEEAIDRRYPNNPWYHVYWESKRNADLGKMISGSITQAVFVKKMSVYAAKASKAAARKIGPAAGLALIIGLARNPWHVAMVKADKTGVVLADIIQRCVRTKFILIGFSLGCRVVYSTLRTLATTGKKKIDTVHLLGGAVSNQNEDWHYASQAVSAKLYNYFSCNDLALKTLYQVGTFFSSKPIGTSPIKIARFCNRDVSKFVSGHMKHKQNFSKFIVGRYRGKRTNNIYFTKDVI